MNSTILAALDHAEKTALSGGVKLVFLVSIAFGCVAIVATFFIRDIDEQLNDDISRKLHLRAEEKIATVGSGHKMDIISPGLDTV
jgi:hypothetical protein